MNNPTCPACGHVFSWSGALARIYGPSRAGTALWGVVCPECGADLKVPNGRMLLIVCAGLFFGSQSSTLLLLGDLPAAGFWLVKLGLVVGFYAIATFFFLSLEIVQE